jgi:hypothetical protein
MVAFIQLSVNVPLVSSSVWEVSCTVRGLDRTFTLNCINATIVYQNYSPWRWPSRVETCRRLLLIKIIYILVHQLVFIVSRFLRIWWRNFRKFRFLYFQEGLLWGIHIYLFYSCHPSWTYLVLSLFMFLFLCTEILLNAEVLSPKVTFA